MAAKKKKNDIPEVVGNPSDPHGMAVMMEKNIQWLEARNYSLRTIRNRRIHISSFILWAEDRGIVRPCEVTKPILERYQRYLYHYRKKDGKPLTFVSQRDQIVPLRAWFKWLCKNNYILYNPASELELPKVGHRLPKHVLSVKETETVLATPDLDDPLGIRDRAILETLNSTGIRRMELINLQIFDTDVDRGTLMIRQGKGKKDRVIPIGDRALGWIDKYLTEVRPSLATDPTCSTLFLSNVGQPFAEDYLSRMVREYIEDSGIGKTGSCHLFRHTMATQMLENGADARFLQAMLGHKHLETTQIYTQVSIRKLKEIHTATHPARMERTDKTSSDQETPNPPEPENS